MANKTYEEWLGIYYDADEGTPEEAEALLEAAKLVGKDIERAGTVVDEVVYLQSGSDEDKELAVKVVSLLDADILVLMAGRFSYVDFIDFYLKALARRNDGLVVMKRLKEVNNKRNTEYLWLRINGVPLIKPVLSTLGKKIAEIESKQ